MDTVPEVPKCFGMFPPKHATYLISIFGLGTGGCGLAGIIMYGLVENSAVAHFMKSNQTDDGVKKAVLLTIGLTSLLLFIGSFLVFIGVACKSMMSLTIGAWLIFFMCMLLVITCIALPMACFFIPASCVIKKLSSSLLVMGYIIITFFLWIWLYFVVVIFNHLNSM